MTTTSSDLPRRELGVGGAALLLLPEHADARGALAVGQAPETLPFVPQRFFLVYGVRGGADRGAHAHRTCHQLMICVAGSCKVALDDGRAEIEIALTSPRQALHVPPLIWGVQRDHSEDAVLLVLASEAYDAAEYIRDRAELVALAAAPAASAAAAPPARDWFVHPSGICESTHVGKGTRVWAFAHVLPGARIGADCNVCDHVFVENDVVVGDRVTLKSGVQLWDGIRLEDDVFVGPNATFSNDRFPRSKQYPGTFPQTIVERGASIGANATILPGLRIGAGAMVGAGAVVTRDVPPNTVVIGNPARVLRHVDRRST